VGRFDLLGQGSMGREGGKRQEEDLDWDESHPQGVEIVHGQLQNEGAFGAYG
jgi:hypothetical protein